MIRLKSPGELNPTGCDVSPCDTFVILAKVGSRPSGCNYNINPESAMLKINTKDFWSVSLECVVTSENITGKYQIWIMMTVTRFYLKDNCANFNDHFILLCNLS